MDHAMSQGNDFRPNFNTVIKFVGGHKGLLFCLKAFL